MAFTYLSEFAKKTGFNHFGRQRNNSDVVIATDICAQGKKSSYALRVSITAEIAKKARILPGDMVDIAFDQDTSPPMGKLTRVISGGWKIGKVGGAKGNSNSRLSVKIHFIKGMPSFANATGCVAIVTEEGIIFDISGDYSFTKNIREENLSKQNNLIRK